MAGNIKGIIVEIGGDTSKLQSALKKVNSSTASLSKELRGINSLLKLDPKNTELVSQKQKVLADNIKETSKKLEELKNIKQLADEKMANGGEITEENYRKVQREIIQTENKLKDLQVQSSKWTSASRSIEEFGNKVSNISDKIGKVGSILTTRITLPIIALATAMINEAKEFETAFTGVEKTVDGTAEQMKKLKQGIKDMSEVIPASTSEISAVAEAAGQLGIETDNVLEFTKTMINMGNATNLSADEAATTLARFANITKMSQSDFDRLGSVIVALGNNFATTEAEISAMGMNLASAGTQVGMSQSQIMALATALSSVGLEAQAGGTAFSKVMVNMQLAVEKGGTELKKFATVAGMTTTQFQKAFKEDATTAIMQFVDGLSKSGEKGQSAIKILDDMGITETRLRDALLRSANASKIMKEAVELGNKAWKENTALTNEADKRYQTLDSRLEMTKNKIKNVATNTGDKLTPTFNKLLNSVDGLIDKFGNLSEEEVKNILKISALVASIGPAIKIIEILGQTTGTAIKGMSNLTQAIGLIGKTSTVAFKEASSGTQTLATMLTFLKTPAGIATIAITATAAALAYLVFKQTEAQKEAHKFAENMAKSRKELEEYNQSINDTTNANLSHINSVSKLKEELKSLVYENGKVKEGYKNRVDFILKELNEALGKEYKLNGDIIEGYKNLQNEIDKTIEKKRAEIILKSQEEQYNSALEQQENAVKNLKDAYNNLGMPIEEANKKLNELQNVFDKQKYMPGINGLLVSAKTNKEIDTLQNLIKGYNDAEFAVKDYTNKVNTYTNNYEKFVSEKYSEIEYIITNKTENWSEKSLDEVKKSIQEQSKSLKQYKDIYINTGNEIASELKEQAKNNLENLAEELSSRTSTIEELGQDEIEAWKTLATNSYDIYCRTVSEMSPEIKKKIEEITGVIVDYTPLFAETMSNLAENGIEALDKNSEFKEEAIENLQGFLVGLNDKDKRELIKQAGIEDANLIIQELDKGNLSEENGKNILQGLYNGLKNGTLRNKIISIATSLAQAVNNAFTGKKGWDEHSPSKKMKQFTEYYLQPITDVIKANQNDIIITARELANNINSVFDNQIKTPQIQDLGKLQSSLNNHIMENTKTIYTTPNLTIYTQEFDARKIANEVNKVFGSQY